MKTLNTLENPAKPVASKLEVRLSIHSRQFLQEFDQFINVELDRIIDRLSYDLGKKLPSINHDIIKSGTTYSIILSLTNGDKVASYQIDIDTQCNQFILKSDDQRISLPSSDTLGDFLQQLIYSVFKSHG